jgi:hypothetical protein
MAPAAEDAGSPSTLYRYRLSHPNGLSWTRTGVADPDSRVFSIDSRGSDLTCCAPLFRSEIQI